MTTPDLFAAVDGLRFWFRADVFVIRCGHYANGRPALAYAGRGETTKITVNIPDEDLAGRDEFFVKWAGDEGALASADMHIIHKLGLFEDTGRRVSIGFVEDYAAIWTFKLCWWNAHSGKDSARVICPDCRADFEKNVAKHIENREAREAIGRLEELARIESGRAPPTRPDWPARGPRFSNTPRKKR